MCVAPLRCSIFLDVDDLEDIGNLEAYVGATGVMLFFLSKKYFHSRNCLREISSSLEQDKPLVLVHEQQQDKGGAPLDVLKAECRDDEMRGKLFDGCVPIVWHRVSHYQNLTLKLIATEMFSQGPAYGSYYSKSELTLVLPGELDVSEMELTKRAVLWCSAANPGATAIAQELRSSKASGGAALHVVNSQPDAQTLQDNGESAFMLLYLNDKTWVEQGEALERDVRAARAGQPGVKIVMVHENDRVKGGCEFGTFFGTTPQSLINEGIYKEIAIALHTPPHRAVSLALVAQALGATKVKAKQRQATTSTLASPASSSTLEQDGTMADV